MRILYVSHVWPWPARGGGQIRVSNLLSALGGVGTVDLVVLRTQGPRSRWELPTDAPIARYLVEPMPASPVRGPLRAAWLVGGRTPSALCGRSFREARARLSAWAERRYDLVWFQRVQSYVAFAPCVTGPAFVDFDDLEDHKSLSRVSALDTGLSDGVHDEARTLGLRIQERKNARLWHRLQQEIAEAVPAVGVCSEFDRGRLGARNAVVVPNGYEQPPMPLGRISVRRPPTILFQGSLTYGPNIDAARCLVLEILPRIRDRVPEARVRLVGPSSPVAQRLHRPPVVTMTGAVPTMAPELARADVVAVPVRFGGGTRIKILEAFAHRIPVVATRLAAEGIEAADGQHLLLRDDPAGFAEGCIELLTSADLRRSLVDAAHELYLERYRWGPIREGVGRLAQDLSQATDNGGLRTVEKLITG